MNPPDHGPHSPHLEQWERDETLRTLMNIAREAPSPEEFDTKVLPQLRRLTDKQRDEIFAAWGTFVANPMRAN